MKWNKWSRCWHCNTRPDLQPMPSPPPLSSTCHSRISTDNGLVMIGCPIGCPRKIYRKQWFAPNSLESPIRLWSPDVSCTCSGTLFSPRAPPSGRSTSQDLHDDLTRSRTGGQLRAAYAQSDGQQHWKTIYDVHVVDLMDTCLFHLQQDIHTCRYLVTNQFDSSIPAMSPCLHDPSRHKPPEKGVLIKADGVQDLCLCRFLTIQNRDM